MTFWDQGRRDRYDAWRRVRVLRSAPPAFVRGGRGPLYSAALEQAQQQFSAAERVAVESRAINLFYGLSQAGRALACAYAPADEPYELTHHGITNPGLDLATVSTFPEIAVRRTGTADASFRRLSVLLNSADVETPIPLSALWPMLVEPQMHGLGLSKATFPALNVTASLEDFESDVVVSFPMQLLPDASDQIDIPALAKTYPALKGATVTNNGGRGKNAVGEEQAHFYIKFPPGVRPLTLYRGTEVSLPAPPGTDQELHPLMTWWAILFTMSMLTRYRSRTWTDIVNVDHSSYAVPTEFLLDVALDSVPDLLAYALDEAPAS